MEGVVYEGWLVKSPPEKRILKAKWRQRWFVLRHSGLLPGQFLLEYFTDNSCKKLKGRIDLDQCELMVEAGLTFEGKKTNYQYMFDVRTPKRIYYLVAETEAEMNKWVDCICTVCGLKLLVEEDYSAPQKQPPSNPMVTSPPRSNLVKSKSSSNPYIPISECHTGKPVHNGDVLMDGSFNDLPREAPPAPPRSESQERSNSNEFYVVPRSVHSSSMTIESAVHPSDLHLEETYKIPSQFKFNSSNMMDMSNGCKTLPPRVNWTTHPNDTPITSTGSLNRKNLQERNSGDAYDIVPPLHSSHRRLESLRKEVQELAHEFDNANIVETTIGLQSALIKAPPRPPKPSKMRDRHDYENFEPIHAAAVKTDDTAYDVPPPVQNGTLAKSSVVETRNSLNEEVPLSSSMDDTYDFPKSRTEDNINSTLPKQSSGGTSARQRRHAYSNAPPGLFNSKELIFNYEYRPSLNDYINMDSNGKQQELISSGEAGGNSDGAYANLPASPTSINAKSDVPPAVNRGLKPKRSMDKGTVNFLTLQPPPLYKTRANKHSFRTPGEKFSGKPAPSPNVFTGLNSTPPVPNRFRHNQDLVMASEDEVSSSGSRHNSSNDEQTRMYFSGAPVKKSEIQYLDLDLDSEPSPSPKSPERVSATVYKKVDFVKTKAFNETRQNVEESYRKSQ